MQILRNDLKSSECLINIYRTSEIKINVIFWTIKGHVIAQY
jgi:hypothetical protein